MKASRLGTILWTLAAAVLIHGIVRQLELGGLWQGLADLGTSLLPEGAPATGIADALLLGLLLGGLPLLAGLRSRHVPEAALEIAVGMGLTAGAAALLFAPLDWVVTTTERPLLVYANLLGGLAGVALATDGCAGRLRTLIGVELLKVWRGRLLRTGLLVAIAATVLAGLAHEPGPGESGWTRAAHALGVGFWTAEILVLVLGATMVAGEISQSTMKMILPHAYRRAEWVAAKATVLVLCAGLFALVVSLTGILHTTADAGLDDVTREAVAGFGAEEEVEVFQTAAVMRGRMIDMALAATASLIASALVGLLLSCLFQSLVPALSASFLVFAALKTGDIFLGFSKKTLDAVYAHYPDELRRLTENFGRALNESWDDTLLPMGLTLGLLTGVLCLLISLRVFGRRDLQ
ncbi:MAG: hypothetical protein P1V36_13390 [Planctomycetota bacterium]|nr:hypothetical protein [Planctomycetota bacterium]